MDNNQGVFIVLEGVDGSGKTTQFNILKKRLEEQGHSVEVFKFPRYDQASSYFIKKYLNGDYGSASSISPYTATLFYALDRYEAALSIRNALSEGKIVLADRYVGSNMAHQGSKIEDNIDKRSFFVWEDSLEFQLLNIPRPTLNLFLRVPAEVSFELIGGREKREYTDKTRDEHEADIEHLKKSVATYDLLCQLFPKDFKAIDCTESGKLLPIEQISELVWQQLSGVLPNLPEASTESAQTVNKTVAKSEPNQPTLQEQDLKVSGFSLHCLISLRQLGLDLRIDTEGSWAGKGTSYKFATPSGLSRTALESYTTNYKKIAAQHEHILANLSKYYRSNLKINQKEASAKARGLCMSLIPMGALFSCWVHLEKSTIEKTLPKLIRNPDAEIRAFGEGLADIASKTWADLSADREDTNSAPKSIHEILASLADSNLPQNLSSDEPAKLLEVSPKNEFDLLADGIYPFSDLSRDEIKIAVTKWDYQQKARTLKDAILANTDLLDLATYRYDVLIDRVSLIALLADVPGLNFQLQQATVRYGYEVPEIIESAGEEERYMQAFDAFLELFSLIQNNDATDNLDYATLAGHKVRWQGSLSAANLSKINSTSDIDEQTRKYIIELAEQAHPIIGEFITKPQKSRAKTPKKS